MVGLPARGKTHTAQKLRRFLRWLGIKCEIFDVGHLRRGTYGAQPSADFFDHGMQAPSLTVTPMRTADARAAAAGEGCWPTEDNKDAAEARLNVARSALRAMLEYMEVGGQVGIYDASNTTRAVRATLLAEFSAKSIQVARRSKHARAHRASA